MSYRRDNVAGFTLIETVVALMVVALGMTAVYMQIGQFAGNAVLMQDKTLASWIGSNIVTELSIALDWPEIGDSEEEIEYANRLWYVTIEITDVKHLDRVVKSVKAVPGVLAVERATR